tara:strand:+ start:33539 stop:33886 length:348 start_codon:yes stop_codon:yes gene_type:complete
MPQEIEVWYLIPALRKEIAKALIKDFQKSQKDVSVILGISEGAVSQYLNSKRGSELKFSKEELEEIRRVAEKIIKEGEVDQNFYKLCVKLRGCHSLCSFHKKQDKNLPKNCDMCC